MSAGVSAAVAGTAGVGVSGDVQVVTSNTSAYVGKSAQVNVPNDGANAQQSVYVAAGNVLHQLMITASIAASGSVGVGASVGVGVDETNTDATIDQSATVNAAKDVFVTAYGNDTATTVTASGGFGTYGVAGAVTVTRIKSHTFADTGTSVTINAGNNVLIAARDDTKGSVITGGTGGGFVGVGAAVGVTTITKDTEAFIGANSKVDARATQANGLGGVYDGTITGLGFGTQSGFHGLAVQAGSTENLFSLAVSIAGGYVGVAGAVDVDLLHVTTKAFVGANALVNTLSGAGNAQSVNVTAVDSTQTLTVGGGAAGGVAGVGGGVNVGVVQVTANAYLDSGSQVHANNNVDVNALSVKQVHTYAVSIAGGILGVTGSVSVWTVGTQATTTYSDGAVDRGVWDPNASYKKGDIITATDGAAYSAKADLNGPNTPNPANGANPGQWEPAQAPLNGSPGDRDRGAWNLNTDYKQGDYVSVQVNGQTKWFSATQDLSSPSDDPSAGPSSEWASAADPHSSAASEADDQASDKGGTGYTSILNGTSQGSNDPADMQIHDVVAGTDTQPGVNQKLSDSAGRIGSVSQTLTNDANVSQGTVAAVNGTVVAGHSIHVRANEGLDFDGLAGTASGGLLSLSGAVLICNVHSNVEAKVGAGASLTAGGGGGDGVGVSADHTGSTSGLAFAGQVGLVAVGAQVVVINDTSTQNAHVDDSAAIRRAGGGIDVEANDTRAVTPLAAGGALAGVAAGAAVAIGNVSGDTEATIGNVAIGDSGPIGSLTVAAASTITLPVTAYSVQAGVLGAISGAVPIAEIDGTTQASSGRTATSWAT